jgi:hypothetical protein
MSRTHGPVAGTDEDVLGTRSAVEEVPGAEVTLLALDEQQAFAGEHEEVLLRLLAVVQPFGCPGNSTVSLMPRSVNSASGDSNMQLAPKTSCVSQAASATLTTNQPSVFGARPDP